MTIQSDPARPIAVYGATGHTGRFVAAELRRRGLPTLLLGRDGGKLDALAPLHPGAERRVASANPRSLERALAGAAAVVNCAGPFIDTATPLVEAALRAGIHYLDVTAEQPVAAAIFERFDAAARRAGIVVAPAMAFYGGLADSMATVAVGDWPAVDEIGIGVALDSWHPTAGTRLTGKRNTAARLVVTGGRMTPLASPPPTRGWDFPEPFGPRQVVELPFTEVVTIARHLRSPEIHAYMNVEPLADLRDPQTPAPVAVDGRGRSAQRFMMQVSTRSGASQRRVTAAGRDIYAITAPIAVEAATRIVAGRIRIPSGALAAGQLFDAEDFLRALPLDRLSIETI